MQEELKTNLQSRLRFQDETSAPTDDDDRRGTTTDTPPDSEITADEDWPAEAEGQQDETNLDPDPLPDAWRSEGDGHI